MATKTKCPKCGNYKAPLASVCGECMGYTVTFSEEELQLIKESEDEIKRDFA